MAVRGSLASILASSAWMKGVKDGSGRGGRDGWGVAVCCVASSALMREVILEEVEGVKGRSMSVSEK